MRAGTLVDPWLPNRGGDSITRDRETDALRNAAAPMLEEIRRHRARAPGELKKVFTVIAWI